MTGNDYQIYAMRTNDRQFDERMKRLGDTGQVLDSCIGLSGEVGEVNDIIKKWLFHGHTLNEQDLKNELGDVCWYIALMCDYFHWEMDDVMQCNIDKLKARYPDGFNENNSRNRGE